MGQGLSPGLQARAKPVPALEKLQKRQRVMIATIKTKTKTNAENQKIFWKWLR